MSDPVDDAIRNGTQLSVDEILSSRYGIGARAVNNVLRGVAQIPALPFGLAGILGSTRGADIAQSIGDTANRQLHTTDARFDTDPEAFALQSLGSSLVGVGPATLARFGVNPAQSVVSRGVRGLLEGITPLTLPLTTKRVLLNTAVGGAVGAGFEEARDRALADAPQRQLTDWIDAPQAAAAAPATQQPQQSYQTASSDWIDAPTINVQAQAQTAPSDDGGWIDAPTTVAEPPPQTRGERIAERWLPYAGAALLGTGGYYGARQGIAARRSADAMRGTVISPGPERDPTVAQDSLLTKGVTAVFDTNASLHSVVDDATSKGWIDAPQAQVVKATADVTLNRAARDGQVMAALQSGVLPNGKYMGDSMRGLLSDFDTINRADAVKGTRIQEAVVLMDEAGNRARAVEEAKYTQLAVDPATGTAPMVPIRELNVGTMSWSDKYDVSLNKQTGAYLYTPLQTPEPARVNFTDMDYMTLHNRLADVMQDPDARAFVERRKRMMDTVLRYARDEGRFSAGDAALMSKRHPFFRPTVRSSDDGRSYLSRRDISEGAGVQRAQDVFDGDTRYIAQVINEVQHNKGKAMGAEFLQDVQQRMGPSSHVVGKLTKVNEADADAPDAVTFYKNGERVRLEVFNPAMAAMFRNDPKFAVPLFDGIRKAFQYLTTGPGASLLTGFPGFAPISALYNTFSGLVTRAAGTSTGYADKLAQSLTGGRVGIRFDPTYLVQIPIAAARDMTDIATREVAAWMSQHPTLKQYAPTLAALYRRSVYNEMGYSGAINTGSAYTGNPNSSGLGGLSPSYDATRGIGGGTPRTAAEQLQEATRMARTANPAVVRRGWQLYKEVLDVVANSPQSAYFRQNIDTMAQRYGNRDTARLVLARRTRQLGADPALHGGSGAVQGGTSMLPYSNIFFQSLYTYGKAFKENPYGTLTALTVGTATVANLGSLSAVLYDEDRIAQGLPPEAVQKRMLESSTTRAGATSFWIPRYGEVRLRLEPAFGAALAPVNWLSDKLHGLHNPDFFAPQYKQDREVLLRMINSNDMETMKAAFSRGFTQFAPPPLADMGARALGVDIRNAMNLSDARITEVGNRHSIGYDQGVVPRDPIGDTPRAIAEGLGSGAVTGVMVLRNAWIVMRDTGDFGKALNSALETRELRAEDRLDFVPKLWSGPERRTSFDANAETMQRADRQFRALNVFDRNLSVPGTIGSGAQTEFSTEGGGRPNVHPESRPLLQQFNQLDRELTADRAERTKLQQRIADMRGNHNRLLQPRALRAAENDINDRIRSINAGMATRVYQREQALSQRFGVSVRLSEFDPNKGLSQFGALED